MQAQPHLARAGDFIVQPRAVGEQVQVVGCRGTARQRQFGQRCLRGNKNIFGGHARPDRVERLEPVEQVGVLSGGHGAREGLVKMVVGVDQTGQHKVAGHIQNFIRVLRQILRAANLLDKPVAGEQSTGDNFPALCIHGNQKVCITDEKRCHIIFRPVLEDEG